MSQIFISHVHEPHDIQLATDVARMLTENLNLRPADIVQTSKPGRALTSGTEVQRELRQKIEAASCVIALITPHFLTSAWCLFEIGAAYYAGRHVIPVLLPPVQRAHLPPYLADLVAIPNILTGDGLGQLRDDLIRICGRDISSGGVVEWNAAVQAFLQVHGHQHVDAEMAPLRCSLGSLPPQQNPIRGSSFGDDSDLFIAFLRTPSVRVAWELLNQHHDDGPRVVEVADVIGQYDLVVKMRTRNTQFSHNNPNQVHAWLLRTLNRGSTIVNPDELQVIDVTKEAEAPTMPREGGRSIRAFVDVQFHARTQAAQARDAIDKAIEHGRGPNRAMRAAYFSNHAASQRAILEYIFGCGGYQDLVQTVSKIETDIEACLSPWSPTKTTVTVMRSDSPST